MVIEVAWMNEQDAMVHQCLVVEPGATVAEVFTQLSLDPKVYQCAVLGRRLSPEEVVPEEGRLDFVRPLHLSPEEARQARRRKDQSMRK
jgi:putative ubiquitin-RnfH superfamily antitoxin RatB of RatAB toxin-antitoxin module